MTLHSEPRLDDTEACVRRALAGLLVAGRLPAHLARHVAVEGTGRLYPTPYRVGVAAGAALACANIAVGELHGRHVRLGLDLDLAAATTAGFRYVTLDGRSVSAPRDPLTGFYDSSDGRSIFLHVNFAHHRRRILALLRAEENRPAIAAAVARWSSDALEEAVQAAGATGATARTETEWRASGAFEALTGLPPVEIIKIADSMPEPLQGGRGLAGLRAIDFTRVLAGPTCGRVLAEFGAAVTRIDNPLFPDLRSYELDANRDKARLELDLGKPDQREHLYRLIARSDIFVQAYRPGVAEVLGVDLQAVAAMRPGIVYASLSAYGPSGPWRDRRGFDSVVQAATGFALTQGDGRPVLLPTSPIDYVAGFLMAFGICVALGRRSREGGSYLVRTSLAQAAMWLAGLGRGDPGLALTDAQREQRLEGYLVNSVTPAGTVRHLRSPVSERHERI